MYIRHKFNQTIDLGKIIVQLDKGTILKNAKMCIFAQKRQHLLNVGKDSCLMFKCNTFQYSLAVCEIFLMFNS